MNTLYRNPFKKNPPTAPTHPTRETKVIKQIKTDDITPNPSQPRFIFEDEPLLRLADSIRRLGILQPLSVRLVQNDINQQPIKYELIAGERRWRAAKILGLETVPCIIFEASDARSAELALVENIQREDLNFFEQAAAISSLIESFGITQEQTARKLSTSQSYVANKLRLLKLTPEERSLIITHSLTERHARALLKITDTQTRLSAIAHIAAKELNVNSTERYIDTLLASDKTHPHQQTVKPHLKDLRFFYNSVDRAVGILKGCGIGVETEKRNMADESVIIIRIQYV